MSSQLVLKTAPNPNTKALRAARPYFLTAMALAAAAAGGATSLRAQTQPAGPGTPVHTIVSVEGRDGKEVPAIQREDVMVNEGHERDNVTGWVPASGQNAGLDLYILIDDSASWRVATQLDELRKFIDALPPSTFVGLGYMRNGTVEMRQDLTTDHDSVAKAVRLPLGNTAGAASPYFSLQELLKRWRGDPARPRREVLMITSGVDLYSPGTADPYLDETIRKAQESGILVHAIYAPGVGHSGHSFWRSNWGQNDLAEITDATGGEAYGLGLNVEFWAPYLQDLSLHLGHQYMLTFLAKAEKKASVRKFRITTEVSEAELVAPTGIFVPASEAGRDPH